MSLVDSPVARRTALGAVAAGLAGVAAAPSATAAPRAARPSSGRADRGQRRLVIGHRGASAYRPEHTLASYELAARMGADFIEPDLVCTRDGVLVARHENEIGGTTDVADHPGFAGRRTTKTVDGVAVTGWFTEDFTLAELKTLRAKERLPSVRQENTLFDGLFEVPTFAEVLALRARLSTELHRTIGVYPETKHPTYFRTIGLQLEPRLVDELRRAGLNQPWAPVFAQSFELNLVGAEQRWGLRTKTVFLTGATGAPYDLVVAGDPRSYADLVTPASLKSLRRSGISGLGPDKNQIIPRRADGALDQPTALVDDAHRAGLVVHPYTFRAENAFLPTELRVGTDPVAYGRELAEQDTFWRTGIDGMFTDHADLGVLSRSLLG